MCHAGFSDSVPLGVKVRHTSIHLTDLRDARVLAGPGFGFDAFTNMKRKSRRQLLKVFSTGAAPVASKALKT